MSVRGMRYRRLALGTADPEVTKLLLQIADEADRGVLATSDWLTIVPRRPSEQPQTVVDALGYTNQRIGLFEMSNAHHYFRAYAIGATLKARRSPRGSLGDKPRTVPRVYHLLAKEAAYTPMRITWMN